MPAKNYAKHTAEELAKLATKLERARDAITTAVGVMNTHGLPQLELFARTALA